MRCKTSSRSSRGDPDTLTPSGANASATALTTAAGEAIAPPSPIPLTPKDLSVSFPDPSHLGDHVTDRRRATDELGRPQADSGVQPREEEPTMRENRNHRIVDASPAAQPGVFHDEKHCPDSFLVAQRP